MHLRLLPRPILARLFYIPYGWLICLRWLVYYVSDGLGETFYRKLSPKNPFKDFLMIFSRRHPCYLLTRVLFFCALGHLLEKMVRKEPWEALKEYFYKKVFPKPQKIYKQLSEYIYKQQWFVILYCLFYSLYISLRRVKEPFEEFTLEALELLNYFFPDGYIFAKKEIPDREARTHRAKGN